MNKDIGLPINMLVNFLESRVIHSEDGPYKIRLSLKEHQAINVYILFLQKSINLTNNFKTIKLILNKMLYTVEFHLLNKKMILKDNAPFLLVNFQIINLLKISDQDLITKDEVFLKFWKCLINNNSDKLLSLARTDLLDLDLNLSNGNCYKTIQKSWFLIKHLKHNKKNSWKTFLPFYKFLLVGGMEKENIKHERTRKIKLKVNSIQKKLLNTWSQHNRYSYNKAIFFINDNNDYNRTTFHGENPENSNVYYSDFDLRDLITPKSVCSRIPWILKTPKGVRESGVFEANKNLKSAITNVKNKNIKFFNLRYKSKKDKSWTIGIPYTSIKSYGNSIGIYEDRTTNFRIQTTEQIKEVKHDSTIHFDGLNYFICVVDKVEMETNTSDNWFCALDPGTRKFQTIYSPDNEDYIMIGSGASKKLYELLLCLDKLISSRSKKGNDLKIKKLRIRIDNLQKELHYKTINFLCNNYKNIYISKLTKDNDIIDKENRKINTKTVRNMVVLGHCKFVERLITKAEQFTNVNVYVISEEYTSQKCLKCKKNTKTGNELYTCKSCSFTIDRDVLGSTNILLKNW